MTWYYIQKTLKPLSENLRVNRLNKVAGYKINTKEGFNLNHSQG